MHQGDGSRGPGQHFRGWPADDDEIPVVGPTPERARTYVAPQELPPVTDHKTLEIETVRLSPEIDPRRMLTQPSLARVRSAHVSPSSVPPPVSHPSAPPGGDHVARPGVWRQLLLWGGALGALLAAVVIAALVVRARVVALPFIASPGLPPSTNESQLVVADPNPAPQRGPTVSRKRVVESTDVAERADVPCALTGASGARAAVLELSHSLLRPSPSVRDRTDDAPASGAATARAPVANGRGAAMDATPAASHRPRPRSLF
jgi:hypothetical protein